MTAPVHGLPETSKPAPLANGLQEAANAAVVAAVLVATAYFGRPLLVPLALSICWPSRSRQWPNFYASLDWAGSAP